MIALDTQGPRACAVCGRDVLTLPGGDALPHAPDTAPGEPEVCLGSGWPTVTRAQADALARTFGTIAHLERQVAAALRAAPTSNDPGGDCPECGRPAGDPEPHRLRCSRRAGAGFVLPAVKGAPSP